MIAPLSGTDLAVDLLAVIGLGLIAYRTVRNTLRRRRTRDRENAAQIYAIGLIRGYLDNGWPADDIRAVLTRNGRPLTNAEWDRLLELVMHSITGTSLDTLTKG